MYIALILLMLVLGTGIGIYGYFPLVPLLFYML